LSAFHSQEEVEEIRAEERIERLADRLAAAAAPIWRFGDGAGGYVRELLEDAFDRAGLLREPRRPSLPRKVRIPAALRKAVLERDGYRCVACGGWRDLTLDHRIPESVGGPTTVDNLQAMCQPCNSRRGVQSPAGAPA
jgi:hypothetical protein